MTNNPLIDIAIIKGDRWEQINALTSGASRATCGRRIDLYDNRPYGIALMQGAYPLLKAWASGEWQVAHQQECLQLLRDAADRRSSPMALAATLAIADHPQQTKAQIWNQLDPVAQAKLTSLHK
jgi:hypothetical protein